MYVPEDLKNLNHETLVSIITSLQQENEQLTSTIGKIRVIIGQISWMNLDEKINFSLFTNRVGNTLRATGIKTYRDLVTTPAWKLKIYRNVGIKTIEEIERVLQSKGWYLGMTLL